MEPQLKGRTMMKKSAFAIATLGVLATFVACSRETTEVSSSTSTYSTEADATVTTETVTTATIEADSTVADAGGQITEGAKMVGRGIKEEARQAVAAGGAAMEEAGQALQNRADAAAPPTPAPAAVAASDVASGASIFRGKCSSCHGTDASGNTSIGKKNNIADFRSSAVQNLNDTELSLMIANGKPGGMSATAHKSKALTPNQFEDVIAFVRSFRG
jgi:mono/diheme cytochrome c family protein